MDVTRPAAPPGPDPVVISPSAYAPDPSPPALRYPLGIPYTPAPRVYGSRELFRNPAEVRRLADEIVRVVAAEGPIHRDLLLERLKMICHS